MGMGIFGNRFFTAKSAKERRKKKEERLWRHFSLLKFYFDPQRFGRRGGWFGFEG
jgi:hypothetical protein